MKLYVAVGRYTIRKNADGMEYPAVIVNTQEKQLGVDEAILWTCLIWNIVTTEELKDKFTQKAMKSNRDPEAFERTLDRLIARGLVVCAEADNSIDVLYRLLSNLYLVPVRYTLVSKGWMFFHLVFKKHVPISIAKVVFAKEEFTEMEQKVLHLANQTLLSSAEIVKCIGTNVTDVSTREKVMDALYDDDISTCDNLGFFMKFFEGHKTVIETISTLYLNRNIIFERLS